MSATDVDSLTATSLSAQLQAGTTTSEGATRSYLARAEAMADHNAFVTLDAPGAVAAALASDERRAGGRAASALDGVPIVIKDNIQWAGLPTTAGTPALARFVPRSDAAVARSLRDAGAVLLGKTAMHEIAFGMSGWNPSFATGPEIGVRNAYDRTRMAGGSSSGNGVALGARIAPAGLGTDTGGSMRIPAALNGVAGMRPSVGRYPQRGVVPASHTRDTPGPTGITVADVELVDRIVTGNAPVGAIELRGLRLGVAPSYFQQGLDDDVEAAFALTLDRLRDAGVAVVEVGMDGLAAIDAAITFPVTLWESYDDMVVWLLDNEVGLTIEEFGAAIASPDVKAVYENGVLPRALPGERGATGDLERAYRIAITERRPQMIDLYARTFREHRLDARASTTVPAVAPPAGPETNDPEVFAAFIHNTTPGSNAGVPGLALPMGLGASSGLPVGLALDGPAGQDRRLLSIGMGIERVLGTLPAPRHHAPNRRRPATSDQGPT